MAQDSIFSQIGFDCALQSSFNKIREFIEDAGGCNATLYKPQRMKQARAAYVPPGEGGKRAKQVFAMIEPRKNSIAILRRRAYRSGKPKEQWQILVGSDFSDWTNLKSALKEWYLDPKRPKKPRAQKEFGDGHALPGGLPETNRTKF